jgi:hypothetical protein
VTKAHHPHSVDLNLIPQQFIKLCCDLSSICSVNLIMLSTRWAVYSAPSDVSQAFICMFNNVSISYDAFYIT